MFRHRVFNSTALNYLFFDIGASGTTATIVGESVLVIVRFLTLLKVAICLNCGVWTAVDVIEGTC